VKQPAIDLQVVKVQSHFVPMGWLSNRAPMALFKRRGGSHICEQVALKKRVSHTGLASGKLPVKKVLFYGNGREILMKAV